MNKNERFIIIVVCFSLILNGIADMLYMNNNNGKVKKLSLKVEKLDTELASYRKTLNLEKK